MSETKTPRSAAITRRALLGSGAGVAIVSSGLVQAATRIAAPDFVIRTGDLSIAVTALSDRAFRVRVAPVGAPPATPSEMLAPIAKPPIPKRTREGSRTVLTLPHARCMWDEATGCLSFHDGGGKLLLSEAPGSRHVAPSTIGTEPTLAVTQGFASPADERLYGTGCFQDGHLDIRGLPRRLTQVNTQISQLFVLSSKGYGLLWHNPGMAELNRPDRAIALTRRAAAGAARMADVTTSTGNARVERRDAEFTGTFSVPQSGRYAFLLDLGRKMSSRHYLAIDGKPLTDHTNAWLPPTASVIGALAAGEHSVLVRASDEDVPVLAFAPVEDRTTWSSPVSEGIDYVVIAGPTSAQVMAGYHALLGPQPMMPLWALGYIHCRERFHSSDEILATAREFRARKLPCDMMVQDWQYWGKYGWNAMRFDEDHYPDPAGLVRDLHAIDMRFMLSVWSKVGKETELGKDVAAKRFYIPGTEWIDFFNPVAARFYAQQQTQKLGALGIDAWWQDATEPENDDLAGRPIYAAPGRTQPGEKRRNLYPLQVSRTVYEAQRRAYPDKRVMILTRSAAPGQQRYGAATWSGDIGHDWETLKRQIPAGLNMAAAGQAWWTVDAGGFFRPGKGQYTDPAYQERFLRWFQFATFLPMTRVHGYMTDTEFWRYGETVERVARFYLELRYRLLPYIYSLAAEASASGMPLIRPLVFEFPDDPKALDQVHAYMFGSAIHVAPVLAADVTTWDVYLPISEGGWYDFWTNEHRAGGRTYTVAVTLDRIPLHVRAGSILPLGPVGQSTARLLGGPLDLMVYPGRDGTASLYEDDGLSYRYEQGAAARMMLTWEQSAGVLALGTRQGTYPGMTKRREIRVHVMRPGTAALLASAGLAVDYDGRAKRMTVLA
ncbi:glycoside hydrolase family 31 protein [Sphingomonas echinoides]|uniref:glycoside hydrolase family 31 protein n=1 Tax=Sphingomonas echinoides TaxID=59803 RepID=UPI0024134222|nr:TIM-barrel domain-containing protein [Sphingomonas echinoides]